MKIDGKAINPKFEGLVKAFIDSANFVKKSNPENGKEYYSLDKNSYLILLTIARLTENESSNKDSK